MSKEVKFTKSTQKPIELNVRKSVITPPVGLPEGEDVMLEVEKERQPKPFNMTEKDIVKWLHKTNQTGWQNKSIEQETLFPNEKPANAKAVNMKKQVLKNTNIDQKYTNDFMMKSKFGYNTIVPDNATTNNKIQTFGAKDEVIKNRLKNNNESFLYGYQGWEGNKLWMSSYLNKEGNGKF